MIKEFSVQIEVVSEADEDTAELVEEELSKTIDEMGLSVMSISVKQRGI